ncbi:MAG: hypothetical protein H6732_09770 [Alphaproteobacteria bacterium]|nr:hypothetical protein [Alphaproteobacteria bacterium]
MRWVWLAAVVAGCEVADDKATDTDVDTDVALTSLEVLGPDDGLDVREEDGMLVRLRVVGLRGTADVIRADGEVIGEAEVDADGDVEIPCTLAGPGTLTWTVRLADTTTDARLLYVHAAPTTPGVRFEPVTPVTGDSVALVLSPPAEDEEGDVVGYRHRWTRDGEFAGESNALGDGPVVRGEVVEVEVVAFDDWHELEPVRRSVTVGNAPPTVDSLTWAPLVPTVGQNVTVTVAASDPEGDGLRVRTFYGPDSTATLPFTGAFKVPAGGTTTWVRVTVDDGQGGLVQRTQDISLGNLPPTVVRIDFYPSNPTTGVALRVAGVVSDPEGETVTRSYRWFLDDAELPGPGTEFYPRTPARGDRIAVQVDVQDPAGATGSLRSGVVVVGNGRPSPPTVSLVPAAPVAGQAITCAVTPGADPEGDTLTPSSTWIGPGGTWGPGPDLPESVTQTGETWRCDGRVSDGTDSSSSKSVSVVIGAPPS